MTIGTIGRLAAVITLFSVLAFAGAAQASCDSDDRVSTGDSECLVATWDNDSWNAKNYCLHKIKVKADVRNGSDHSATVDRLAPGQTCTTYPNGSSVCSTSWSSPQRQWIPGEKSGRLTNTSWGRRIRSVKCCSDYSDCNRKSTDTYDDDFPVPSG